MSGVFYFKSDAAGSGTGLTPEDAFFGTTFGALQDAIDAISAGDTLICLAPDGVSSVTRVSQASVFATTDDQTISYSGKTVQMSAGFAVSMQHRASALSWTDEGSGVYSIALALEPYRVFWQFQQDDSTGTVTGVDQTATDKAEAIRVQRARGGINHAAAKDDVYNQWYGTLTKTAGTQTAPGEGEYGYDTGRLYVNPSGSPTLAEIAADLTWSGIGNGFVLSGTSPELIGVAGEIHIIGHGDAGGAGAAGGNGNSGYLVQVSGGTGAVVRNVAGPAGGWHTFGAAVGDATDFTFDGCISIGMDDLAHDDEASQPSVIPFVAFNLTNSDFDMGATFRNCAHVHVGFATTAGTSVAFGKSCLAFFAHLGSGTRVRGVTVTNPLLLDYSQELSNAAIGGAIYEPADEDVDQDTPLTPLLARDEANWSHKCIGAVGAGQSAIPGFNCYNRDFYLIRSGAGSATEPIKNVNFASNPTRMYHIGRGYWDHGLTDQAIIGHATRGLICIDGPIIESGSGTLGVIDQMRGTADTAYLRNLTHSGTSAGPGANIGPRFILDGQIRAATENPFSAGGGGNTFAPTYVVATSNASLLESNNNTVAEMIALGEAALSGTFFDALTWTAAPGPITITGISTSSATTTVTWSSPSSSSVSVELYTGDSPTGSTTADATTTADTGTLAVTGVGTVWMRVVDGSTAAKSAWINLAAGAEVLLFGQRSARDRSRLRT